MSLEDLKQRGEGDIGYVLVDFDRTLSTYESWEKNEKMLGMPILPNVERVKRWTEEGFEVRIFTARACPTNPNLALDLKRIDEWCQEVFGVSLPITNQKDFGCIAILDDLAMAVEPNTGTLLHHHHFDPLTIDEEIELQERMIETYK